MRAKKTAPSRRKISFAVNRDEVDVNSDWVDAVMAGPAPVVRETSPEVAADRQQVPVDPLPTLKFFSAHQNSSTDADTTTEAGCSSVEIPAAVAETASVEVSATVEANEEECDGTIPAQEHSGREAVTSDVANTATVDENAADQSPVRPHRALRRRPLARITDGLTPGQYSVYRLMYEEGKSGEGGDARLYRGGYADLVRLTGMSKRGIQNVVAELQAKHVISIQQKPGHHRTEMSVYAVLSAEKVLDMWFSYGWRYAAGKSKVLMA